MYRTLRRSPAPIIAIVSLILLACGCGSANTSREQRDASAATLTPTPVVRSVYPLVLPAGDERSVTLTAAPRRIVSLSPGHTEILFAISAGGQVVGTDRFSNFPEEARSLPKVEYSNTNVEAVVALRPDLVLAAGRQRNLVPIFEQAGLTVLPLEEPGSVAGVVERIRLMGRITDHIHEAESLALHLEERISALTERLSDVSGGPRVYHEIDPKLFSATQNSFIGDIYTTLKAQNVVTPGQNPYPQIAAEAIIQADPEVIVVGHRLPEGAPDEVKRRPGWNVISAVKSGRVYVIEDDLISRPGPRVVDALEQVARILYPSRFP
jgi:iron complex transport system substrate-binding protein